MVPKGTRHYETPRDVPSDDVRSGRLKFDSGRRGQSFLPFVSLLFTSSDNTNPEPGRFAARLSEGV
jgi:hypothetical protein